MLSNLPDQFEKQVLKHLWPSVKLGEKLKAFSWTSIRADLNIYNIEY